MTQEPVLLDRAGSAAVLRLNRPEKHNALDLASQTRLLELLDELAGDESVRAVVLTGGPKAFSSGADLGMSGSQPSARDTVPRLRRFRRLADAIEQHPKPVIAAISGWCLTGGLELALCCDIRIADESARFGITSSKLGSVAGFGGTQRLPRIVGVAKAKEMLFLAEFIDAQEAYRINLVNRLVPAGSAVSEALRMVAVLDERGPIAVQSAKQAVNTGMQMDLHSALEWELSLVAQVCDTEDRAEGARAFLERRKPNFHGR